MWTQWTRRGAVFDIGVLLLLGLLVLLLPAGCRPRSGASELSANETFAELRTIKGALNVVAPGETARRSFPRERLVGGQRVEVPAGGLAWMRRDAGATWLISGPAQLTVHADRVELKQGRVFVDSEAGDPVSVETPRGLLELSDARASVETSDNGGVSVYVLRGSARASDAERATAGELLTLHADGRVERRGMLAWEDWTGGLGTADPAADPAPFGIGTVGARKPGDQGQPRFSLVIQRMDVKVTIDQDYAVTEVDQTFVNPSPDTVEGLFSFRTPRGAVLQRFGVDRDGELVWGRVKESAEARAQYESNVYAGSEEDPALLQWAGAGVYSARLYPIKPGTIRRVVTRYGEWLPRQGPKAERRLYVYPMAAEGARSSLPRIEELTITLDLKRADARSVRTGMGGKRDGDRVVVKKFDFVPRADLAVELFDAGQSDAVAYRARHELPEEEAPEGAEEGFSKRVSEEEADYLAIPVRAPPPGPEDSTGIDLAIVVDTSAATEPWALSIARGIAGSLLAHLGAEDRAALWTGDATLRPAAENSGKLTGVDAAQRKAWLAGLAAAERGGASDLGALLTEAATHLDPKRRGTVVYVGDGVPSVGELAPQALRERLARLPASTRILVAAVGSQPNLPLLESITRGAPVEQVFDGYGAARSALRLLEAAGRPLWLGASLDLGAGVERILPRQLPPISSDETLLVVGRIGGTTSKKPTLPTELALTGSGGTDRRRLTVRQLDDAGDLRRRWGEQRMFELMAENAGRASLVDLGRRYGLVSPFTSLYVPTRREAAAEEESEEVVQERERRKLLRWKPWLRTPSLEESPIYAALMAEESPDNKEGGTGTRAKGEEGSMGKAPAPPATVTTSLTNRRYAVQGPKDNDPSPADQALREAAEFGMIGLSKAGAAGDPDAPAAPWGRDSPPDGSLLKEMKARAGADIVDEAPEERMRPTTAPAQQPAAPAAGGLGLRGIGEGGSGRGESPGLGSTGTLGHGTGVGTGAGFGAGHGRLGGSHKTSAPKIRMGAVTVTYSDAPSSSDATTTVKVTQSLLGRVGHEPSPCGPAADLPLGERRILWRERLSGNSGVSSSIDVYRNALRNCEASDWRERSLLLVQIVDHLQHIPDRVSLWRSLLAISPTAADAVYRFMLLRVQTSAQLKELHDALGLQRIDPEILRKLLDRAKDPRERLALLRGSAEKFPDDAELALQVLDAYEDAKDDAGGRAWARKLRRRADATAHVRTNVGEYYLRLAARGSGAQAQRDSDEGRRTFGEIVEFASEDPLSRRKLGDLLRSHGWHEQALRQYQTLAALTPDDPSVFLLLASAAQGTGKVEEAVRWTEKAGASGSPDGSSAIALASRALASTFLAWARLDSARTGKQDELERLRARASRLATTESSQGARVLLVWSHPELRPSLWTNALGSSMPAEDNLPLFGVAQAFVPQTPSPLLELRLDPEDAARAARLDLKATLTVIANEGADEERIAVLELGFRDASGKPLDRIGLRFEDGTLKPVEPALTQGAAQ